MHEDGITRLSNTIDTLPVLPAPSIEAIIASAVQAGRTGADLKEFLDVFERMKTLERIAAFHAAMANFRKLCPPIPRLHQTTQYKRVTREGISKPGQYAALEDVAAVIDPICGECLLSYRFPLSTLANDHLIVWTKVAHAAGHSEDTQGPPIAVGKPIVSHEGKQVQTVSQVSASVFSFAKRQSLLAAFGISTCEHDDDGVGNGDELITQEEARMLNDLLIQSGMGKEAFLDFFRVTTFAELHAANFIPASNMLVAKIKQQRKGKA